MRNRVIFTLAAITAIAVIALTVIGYGKGLRIDLQNKSITATGILSANSSPDGASIYIDNKLNSATNTSISLTPGWYQVKIGKEGYQAWEKKVRIQGEIVSKIEALLLPINPSLRPITYTGASSTRLSPLGGKIAYIVEDKETATSSGKPKTGVWVQELRNGPLGGKTLPKQILPASSLISFDKNIAKSGLQNISLTWSPDEKQMLILFTQKEKSKDKITSAYQFPTDNPLLLPRDVLSSYKEILTDWNTEVETMKDNQVNALDPGLASFFNSNCNYLKFSPDETRIMYQATRSAQLKPVITPGIIGSNSSVEERQVKQGKYYIYDLKEDKNFLIADETIHNPDSLMWYYDSKHLITIENKTISVVDYDGLNKRTVYTGPFEDNIVYPWNSDGKLIILTNLNKPSSPANLYEIDLR